MIFGGGVCGIWGALDYLEDEYLKKALTVILVKGLMLLGFLKYRNWDFAEYYQLSFSGKYLTLKIKLFVNSEEEIFEEYVQAVDKNFFLKN